MWRSFSKDLVMTDAVAFFQESTPKLEEIRKALEADSIAGKLDAMKRLIAVSASSWYGVPCINRKCACR